MHTSRPILVLTLVLASAAFAKQDALTLSEVLHETSIVVVGTVAAISPDHGADSATIRVEQSWYGDPGSELTISLRPTWTCDGSSATKGERAVFLLSKASDGSWHIAHSGNGRMPIVDGLVSVSPMIALPDEARYDRARENRTRRIPMKRIHQFVQAVLDEHDG